MYSSNMNNIIVSTGDLVNHLFLLKKVPHSNEPNLPEIENEILTCLEKVVQSICRQLCLPKVAELFRTWKEVQCDGDPLNDILTGLANGESTCFYVREQNCTIYFTKLDPNYMRVVTFRSSLPNEAIMATCGSLRVSFPETVDVVPISQLLLSPCFTTQLSHLSRNCCAMAMPTSKKGRHAFGETREPSNPYIVSEFLVSMLCPVDHKKYPKLKNLQIKKKVRDQVNWEDCEVPWRRSGLWMAVKVVLQLALKEEFTMEATIMYKIVILEFLLSVAEKQVGATWNTCHQIMTKLTRRAKKLHDLRAQIGENEKLRWQLESTLQSTWKTIDQINDKVSNEWKKCSVLEKKSLQTVRICREKSEWEEDCFHQMEKMNKYLYSNFPKPRSEGGDNLLSIQPITQINTVSLDSLLLEYQGGLNPQNQDVHLNKLTTWIYHVEWYARKLLTKGEPCARVFELLNAYIEKAAYLYGKQHKDPLSYSLLALTVLQFVKVLDEIAVAGHPLLKEYKTGIESEMLDCLLLPYKEDMQLVKQLQNYFNSRNTRKDFWLKNSKTTEMDFVVQYAKQSFEIQRHKQLVLQETKREITAKHEKVNQARKRCSELQRQINQSSHRYEWNSYRERNEHSRNCQLCDLQALHRERCFSVQPMQLALPDPIRMPDYLQDVVVFEMIIPQEISSLRESTLLFLEDIMGLKKTSYIPKIEKGDENDDDNDEYIKWMKLDELQKYTIRNYQRNCHLISQTKSTLRSHYGANPNVETNLDSAFVLENGLNCMYHRKSEVVTPKHPFTFGIGKTNEKDRESYASLQFALDTNRPTENTAIAKQCKCHANLTLREFKAFGSLRCGGRIQLRNLYAELSAKTLSLGKEPVLQLIMQSVWELGPENGEIHVDFVDTKNSPFAAGFLELLQKLGEQNASNWGNPILLISLVVMSTRILEVSEAWTIKEKAANVLQSYRSILMSWFEKLEKCIDKCIDPDERKTLLQLLLKSALGSILSFDVYSEGNMNYVFRDAADISHYLHSLSKLHQLVVRENILETSSLSPFIVNLLRHARQTVPLNVQDPLHDFLRQPNFNVALHNFTSSKWLKARKVSALPVFYHCGNRDPLKRHAYEANYTVHSVNHKACVDILRGTFFVDGESPSLLPERIIQHPLFQSYFQNGQFSVQPVCGSYEGKYKGQDFEFTECGENLIIRQVAQDTNSFYELLPRKIFRDDIATDLIDIHTHWFNSQTNAVHFCRIVSKEEQEGNLENMTEYLLIPQEGSKAWKLKKCAEDMEHYLLSINSTGFRKITNNLQKLEKNDFIHVSLIQNHQIIATLWMLRLKFSLNSRDSLLYCDNYPGYYIPISKHGGDDFKGGGQNLGTLFGLESGIVLQKLCVSDITGIKKMFLIRHAHILIENDDEKGRLVDKNKKCVRVTGAPRNPPYYVYEVDHVLNRLHPTNSKSAWLYLALLHGATAFPFPDPFTQLTGTEMAMWILESGYVWNCATYDEECTKTLGAIAKLSPKYEYYPCHLKNMQTISWPQGLSSHSYAAYDGYAMIVSRLLRDSARLITGKKKGGHKLELCERSYFRNINMYNAVAHLSDHFMKSQPPPEDFDLKLSTSLQNVGENLKLVEFAQYRRTGTDAPSNASIASFILIKEPLPCHFETAIFHDFVTTWLETSLRSNWLQIYSLAKDPIEKIKHFNGDGRLEIRRVNREHELTLILGALLYSSPILLPQLLNLHNVHVKNTKFPCVPKSVTGSYHPMENEYVRSEICGILQEVIEPAPVEGPEFKTEAQFKRATEEYQTRLRQQTLAASTHIQTQWPTDHIEMSILQQALSGNNLLKSNDTVLKEINGKLKYWNNNRALKIFLQESDQCLSSTPWSWLTEVVHQASATQGTLLCTKIEDKCDDWIARNHKIHELGLNPDDYLKKIFKSGQLNISTEKPPSFDDLMNLCESYANRLRHLIVQECPVQLALEKVSLNPRLSPICLLRYHFTNAKEGLTEGSCLIGALAVTWTHLRRLARLVYYQISGENYAVELTREKLTTPCENWNPRENPEWLLLELELNITIRNIQVDVAKRMMEMPNARNGVMQLNMGEGKTSVIIPMVVAALTAKRDVLCRVTVISSIFATNFNLLSATIGGFLNKRLYSVPCNREIDMVPSLDQVQKTYEECLRLGGAVMTLPEYRLSFRLQAYNHFMQKEKGEAAQKFYEIESWLRNHARDLIDESDEIFSVKYQLIYTTGKQLKVDGGSMRWQVCQKLLRHVQEVAYNLSKNRFENTAIEYKQKSREQFSYVRIISDADIFKAEFLRLMADGIFEGDINLVGEVLTAHEKQILREYLINDNISEDNHRKFFHELNMIPEKKEALMLVSGYLRKGILFTALKKRWRVDYGVRFQTKGSAPKLMAVPFKAKDVASERTEFGHPDMAIVLTQLSYYYNGLLDEQLLQCFEILENKLPKPDAISVYGAWISKFPPNKIIPDTLKTYQSVNLQDPEQRKDLFEILRLNRLVIDFWLENVVYPKECCQFPKKLVTNSNDLVYHRNRHASTGFSGTNDTQLLLPSQIKQQDLECLLKTNEQMEEVLKNEENQWRHSLRMGISCAEVLDLMIKDNLQVLIDAGAVMLELSNEKIAQKWLDLNKELQGVVYFNERGEMVVKTRISSSEKQRRYRKPTQDTLLSLSPFWDRLENCCVYLDDQHSRGTDLKLPTNFKACVTVGSDMRRDKLFQACMRMRKLGQGQTVHFYVSHAADSKICKHDSGIFVKDIVEWTKENSRKFSKEGLMYWATNAKNYAKNLASDDLFAMSGKSIDDGVLLAKRCQDDDCQTLEKMYGTYYHLLPIVELIPIWFTNISRRLETSIPAVVQRTLESIKNETLKKCEEHIPDKKFYHSMLEEEQEKELEPEMEKEPEVQRPPEETPAKPNLHVNLVNMLTYSEKVGRMPGIMTLSDIFRSTTVQFETGIQSEGWDTEWLVTEDFITTVEHTCVKRRGAHKDCLDCFLRSVRFFINFKKSNTRLVLSPFECDQIISQFREGNFPRKTLHMFSARWMEGQGILANDFFLQLPIQQNKQETSFLCENALAPLLIAEGNLFFSSKAEQRAFARFMGLRLREWTAEEENAFENGGIRKTGFVENNHAYLSLREGCSFNEDPTRMVMRILKMRNDATRETDHTVSMLEKVSYLEEK